MKNFLLTISECPLRCLPEDGFPTYGHQHGYTHFGSEHGPIVICKMLVDHDTFVGFSGFPQTFWTTPISLTPNSPLVAPLWAHSSAEGSWVHGFKRRVVLWKTPFLMGQQQAMLLPGLMMFNGHWWWAYFFNGDSCATLTLSTCVCLGGKRRKKTPLFMPHPSVILVKLKCPCHLCHNHIQSLHKLVLVEVLELCT